MWRRILIADNYAALVFYLVSAMLGALITRGQGFEVHFWVTIASLPLVMTAHVGSAIYLAVHPAPGRTRVPLILLNYVAAGFYMWITYAGFMIRQGVPFDYHLTISITGFFFGVSAIVFSALFLALKYKQPPASVDQMPLTQE